jgi:cytochrome c-type biogenesis protein CcmH
MTLFLVICVLMVLIAVALLARPLLQLETVQAEAQSVTGRQLGNRSVLVLTALLVMVLSTGMYLYGSNWQWNAPTTTTGNPSIGAADSPEILALAAQVRANPQDLDALLRLGNAYVLTENFSLGAETYQRAYEVSKGQNLDAITGWAEALILADPSAMNGRASVLIEEAFKLEPKHPRALWYGGLIALQMQNLVLARDRFQTMLDLNPPDAVRRLLERQVLDLNEQLGANASDGAPVAQNAAVADTAGRSITVQVKVSPALQSQIQQPVALFILARNPKQPGPPLAVERHLSSALPLQVELSVADAMLPTRTLKDAEAVEVVARLSASGTPTEQPGDLYGTATYSFAKGEQGSVSIEISQRVP